MTKRNKGVEIGQEMLAHLWEQLLVRLAKNLGMEMPPYFFQQPEEFWKDQDLRRRLINDLQHKTTHRISKIVLIRYEEDEISEDYINNHFVKKTHTRFQPGYLDRMAFYLSAGKMKYWKEYKQLTGALIPDVEEPPPRVLPGLKQLEGYWVGLHKSVKSGRYVKCRYKIWQEFNVMKVEREGYNNEICFSGQVIMQEDGSYAFLLHGRERKGFKHLIANVDYPEQEILKCLSTSVCTESNKPVIIKEILYKVSSAFVIKTGEAILYERLEEQVRNDFGAEEAAQVLSEILAFLGGEESPVFSMEDLHMIKAYHLEKIKNETRGDAPPVFNVQKQAEEQVKPMGMVNFYNGKMAFLGKGIRFGKEIYQDYIFMRFLNVKLNLQLNFLIDCKVRFLKR